MANNRLYIFNFKNMNSFIKKFLLFLLPIILLIIFPFITFYIGGEFIGTKQIMDAKFSNKPMLLGKILPYWGGNFSKTNIIKIIKPNVITLGNSRVLEFRAKFFKNESFYNGGGIGNLTGFEEIIKKFNDSEKPKIIILGLEQSYFNPSSETSETFNLNLESNNKSFAYILDSWRKVYFNIFTGKYSLTNFFQFKNNGVKKIGLQAVVKNAGLRNDGSYEYGDVNNIDDPRNDDYNFKDTLRRMEKGVNLLYQGDKISDKSITILTDFLNYCKSRDIYVVGFLPPYAQEIYDKIKETKKYEYIFNLEKKLKPIFEKNSFGLFDFSNMSSFGAEKTEIVDGLHASEKAYLRLFIKMVKNNKVLGAYSANLDSLETMLKNSY